MPPTKRKAKSSSQPYVLALCGLVGVGVLGFMVWAYWLNDLQWRMAPPLVSDFHYARQAPGEPLRINFTQDYAGMEMVDAERLIESQGFVCTGVSGTVECQRFVPDGRCVEDWKLILILDAQSRIGGGRGDISRQCS